MAASRQVKDLQGAATCSICLEYFTDPVSLDCGHSFCRSCITRSWEGAGAKPPCPQCRSRGRNLRPNRELSLIVELIKLNISPAMGAQEEALCPRHLQRLQLFCAEDHTLLCVVCRESREHKPHTVSPIEEVAQGYRDTLHSHIEQLNTELQDLEQRRTEGLRTASDLEENFENQTERVWRTFGILKEYLEQEKQQLLIRLEQEHEANLEKIQGPLTHLEEQLTTHRDLVAAIEVKCGQSDAELLADVQDILSWCESVKGLNPEGDSEMDQNTLSLRQQDPLHEKIMEIKEGFPAELEWSYVKGFECELTLDPDTAHRGLILSEDGRSVRDGGREQDLPDTPERFETAVIVLGKQRLSSGRHYWEVEVEDATGWDLGVCDESEFRKGDLTLEADHGYWRVGLNDGAYCAYTSPEMPLTPRVPLRVVGLFLDCEPGSLSVYNVQDRSLLFTFSGVFSPSALRPFFYPQLSIGGEPAAALRILPVTAQDRSDSLPFCRQQ